MFERYLEEVRAFLHEIDSSCKHGHYSEVVTTVIYQQVTKMNVLYVYEKHECPDGTPNSVYY